jgi:hypothetical protein
MSGNNEDIIKKIPEDIYEIFLKSLENIKFGLITLIIQDGKVVQIESNEKIRTTYK